MVALRLQEARTFIRSNKKNNNISADTLVLLSKEVKVSFVFHVNWSTTLFFPPQSGQPPLGQHPLAIHAPEID